jgi:hypothetical protein
MSNQSHQPLVVDGDELAEIEPGTEEIAYSKYKGMAWVNSGWLDVDKARALRDWLTAYLSERDTHDQ